MNKKVKGILYAILPAVMLMLCMGMITYIFAATKAELKIEGYIGYEVPKGTGTEEDPFLIYSVGPNDGTATIGSFNFYAGNNVDNINYFSSSSPQYYFKQVEDLEGSDFTQTTLLGFYNGNSYSFNASGSNKAIFSAVGSSSITTSKLYDLNVYNSDSTASAGVATNLYGTIDSVTFSGSIIYSSSYVGGIACYLDRGANILNCTNNATIVGTSYVGGIASYQTLVNSTSNIDGCVNNGEITASAGYASGIISSISGGTVNISNSKNNGNIKVSNPSGTSYYVGGIVASCTVNTLSISGCENSGTITMGNTGGYNGGIIGYASNSVTIEKCSNKGKISSSAYPGGIVGYAVRCTISECYNFGEVYGVQQGGGIAGYAGTTTISHCYNTAKIDTMQYTGGIVGNQSGGSVTNCYSIGTIDASVSSGSYGGIVGYSMPSLGGTTQGSYYLSSSVGSSPTALGSARALTLMQTQGTYSSWTFGTYGSASSGWVFVAAEVLVDGVVQKLVLPRLWWEELTILSTKTVTLQGNGGILDTYTLNETRATPLNIAYTNYTGFSSSINGYATSLSSTASNGYYSLMRVGFDVLAGDKVTLSFSFSKGSYGNAYAYFSNAYASSSSATTFSNSSSKETSYGACYTSSATGGLDYTFTTAGTWYIDVKLVIDLIALPATHSLSCSMASNTVTDSGTVEVTSYNGTIVEGGYFEFPNASKGNYGLLGFSTSSTATTPAYPVDENGRVYITTSGTLYAVWEQPKVYTITFNNNDGTGTTTTQSVTENTTAIITGGTPTRTGYTFKGWSTSPTATTATYSNGTMISLSSDLNLYAVWNIATYTLSFYANGGSGTMTAQTFTHGVPQKINLNTFTKSGYKFIGWDTALIGSSVVYTDGQEITLTGNMLLSPVWATLYTVSSTSQFKTYSSSSYFGNTSYYFQQTANFSLDWSFEYTYRPTTLLATYDGGGYTITFSGSGNLFTAVGSTSNSTATLKNLNITNTGCSSGVIGYSYGNFENVHADYSNYTVMEDEYWEDAWGGIVNAMYAGTMKNCSVKGTVDSGQAIAVGGLVGAIGSGASVRFENCYNTASVYAVTNANQDTVCGGIAGGMALNSSNATSIEFVNCYNTGSVTIGWSNSYTNGYAGGIIGGGNITNLSLSHCYNSGEIDAPRNGGLVGRIQTYSSYSSSTSRVDSNLNIEYCYNSGRLKSTRAYNYDTSSSVSAVSGGLVYQASYYGTTTILNSYNIGVIDDWYNGMCGTIIGVAYQNISSHTLLINNVYGKAINRHYEEFSVDGSEFWEEIEEESLYYFFGEDSTSYVDHVKTESQLLTRSTYSGWTFGTAGYATTGWVWTSSGPRLYWQ